MDTDTGNNGHPELIRRLSRPLSSGRFWLQLVGVMSILYGVLTALSIIGILIAWLPIWMGVMLFQAAGAFERAFDTADEAEMLRAQEKLRTYFTITGVLTLVALLFMALTMFLGAGGAIFGMAHFGHM